jgi:putative DNA primase/helicase
VAELNQDRHIVGVENGVYDLRSHELKPAQRDRLMTRSLGTSYDPDATCPEFEGFMEKVLPQEEIRTYVQRALGYSLLGDADQRSLFLICGPSGTGKSTLMATMELLFGEYGTTAPSGTLRATGREHSGPSNDLHTLMGKRFVSTSETNEHTSYNEDLIKRLTGRDKISSRKLYQEFQEWSPQCTVWLATNHPPRFSSDDDAIWRRAKVVPFHTVLLDDNEIPDFAHNVLAHELPGILNWLLAGLRDYQARGLQEPQSVRDMIRDVRLQSDPVSRFVEDRVSEGLLIQGEGSRIKTTQLYMMYTEWAKLVGERSLGTRRFSNRMMSSFPELDLVKSNGYYTWQGIGRPTEISTNWVIQGHLTT